MDAQGGFAITTTGLADGVGTGFDATLSVGILVANAPTTLDLAGKGRMIGGSVGEGVSVGFESTVASDRYGNDTASIQINAQVGAQGIPVPVPPFIAPVEGHGGYPETTVYPLDPGRWLVDWLRNSIQISPPVLH